MIKRFSMVFFTMVLAIVALLIAAKHPIGPTTVSYDEPAVSSAIFTTFNFIVF